MRHHPSPLTSSGLRCAVLCCLGGLMKLSLTAADGADPAVVPPLDFFGIGACNQTSQNLTSWIPQMAEIGITSMRTARTVWGSIEPKEGEWAWDVLDEQMKYLTDHHISFGGLIYGDVRWDKLDRGGTLPVNNIPAWSSYVTQLVTHCTRKVHYWEVWNEPPNGTGRDQTPADYAKLMIATYDAAHAVDPTCLVGLAAKSVHVNYLEQVIKAGAKGHYDYIVLHPYEVLGGVADDIGSEAIYLNIVPTVRKMLAAQDPAKTSVPIIYTEIGCDAGKSPARQANTLVKAYAMGLAGGVACIEWFEGMDGDSGPMGLLKSDKTPRPSYTAYGTLIKHLGKHPQYLGWTLLNGKHYAFVFQGATGTVLISWAYKGVQDTVDFAKSVSITEPATGMATSAPTWPLTSAPIIVDDVPPALLAEAKANRAKPFSWDGDYSKATSVTITMGEKLVEKGLHNQSGARIAADVIAYGGGSRAGGMPGGNVFMVDPSFLSYTSTPIEISVVVRRNEANDNAGFKLRYESTNGFKDCGWYTVPDNKEWHTMTWTIKDAEFVNYWDYNFSLDSDGPKFNKYFIQSVTVKKLE
jgi:hypothetical protein